MFRKIDEGALAKWVSNCSPMKLFMQIVNASIHLTYLNIFHLIYKIFSLFSSNKSPGFNGIEGICKQNAVAQQYDYENVQFMQLKS